MADFKIGDVVKVVDNPVVSYPGEAGVVVDLTAYSGAIVRLFATGQDHGWHTSWL